MTDAAIDDLLAKQAISEVLYRYCRGLDRMDRPMALSVWHDGATADYGSMYKGTGAGFIHWVWGQHEGMLAHSHQIANILIDVTGDRAVSEAYVTVKLRRQTAPGAIVDLIGSGRYLDRWSKRNGVWAIDERRYAHDFDSVYAPLDPGFPADGRRDRQDPSYALFS